MRRVLGGGRRSEHDRADAVVVAHALLSEPQLGTDSLLGIGDEIDGPAAVDHEDDRHAIERLAEIEAGHGEAGEHSCADPEQLDGEASSGLETL